MANGARQPGATTELKAEGTFQDGHTADVTGAVFWSLSPTVTLTLSAHGNGQGLLP